MLAVVCVLLIFFFPTVHGPYSVVHGPVTALLSMRAAANLRIRIVRSALVTMKGRLFRSGLGFRRVLPAAVPVTRSPIDALSTDSSSILRC